MRCLLWLVSMFFAIQAKPSLPSMEEEERESYDSLVRQGMDALSADSLLQADSLFRQAMQQEPTHQGNHILFRYLGRIKERQGHNQEALDLYTSGLNLSPKDMELRLDRAALLYRMGNQARAASDYSDVLDLQPENMEALQMRAHIYAGMHDYKRARADYETILTIEPLDEKAYIGLILVNDRSGRPREAMEQINALIAVYTRHAVVYAIRGGMEQHRRLYEQALADLTQAIEMEPENADFYVSRATLYLEMKKRKLARHDTQMAIKYGADPIEMASLLK